jgi:hypothetical protein
LRFASASTILETSKQAIDPLPNDLERWGYIERRVAAGDGRGRV